MPKTIDVFLDPLLAVDSFAGASIGIRNGIAGLRNYESTYLNNNKFKDDIINIKLINTGKTANKDSLTNHEDNVYILKLLLSHKNVQLDLTDKKLNSSHGWVTLLAAAAKTQPALYDKVPGLKNQTDNLSILVTIRDEKRANSALKDVGIQMEQEAKRAKLKAAEVKNETPKAQTKISRGKPEGYDEWLRNQKTKELAPTREKAAERTKEFMRPQTAGVRQTIHKPPLRRTQSEPPPTSTAPTTKQPPLKRAESDPTPRGAVKTASHDRGFALRNDNSPTAKTPRPKSSYGK